MRNIVIITGGDFSLLFYLSCAILCQSLRMSSVLKKMALVVDLACSPYSNVGSVDTSKLLRCSQSAR